MTQTTLFEECPLCNQNPVLGQEDENLYRCSNCGLTLEEQKLLGLLARGRFKVTGLGNEAYELGQSSLQNVALPLDQLKVVIGNAYTDQELAEIARGSLEVIRPVRTIVAQIILEQLKETCYLQINGLQRGQGAPIDSSGYRPARPAPRQGMSWQDRGNLFCTNQRLVFPSDSFTFIRLDRKLAAVRAFTNGVAVQRKGEASATYFVGCYPHEAALAAAYILGKLPALRETASELAESG